MSDEQAQQAEQPELTAEQRAARAKRLAEVFGDVLPEQTADDRDSDQPAVDSDAWLRAQVPPHHG